MDGVGNGNGSGGNGYPRAVEDRGGTRTRGGPSASVSSSEAGEGELGVATCFERALFITPEQIEGIFVQLPTDASQPIPYLFVQVLDVQRLAAKRFGRHAGTRNGRVRFSFRPEDVGGLDARFLEQNVSNHPQRAFRALQEYHASSGRDRADSYDDEYYDDDDDDDANGTAQRL